jgi:hypothetical protein
MRKENHGRTKLSEENFNRVHQIALDYLETHEFVTNGIIREIAKINYDQAIVFFARELKGNILTKVGTSKATRYIHNAKKRR